MALMSDAVMVLFCDVVDDPAGHDHWHTYEHLHERLSIPGFLRGSRWTRVAGSPRYMMVYEVASVDMARSPDYLARLNAPTPWTAQTMRRLLDMRRGFCRVTMSAGYGLGRTAMVLRLGKVDDEARGKLAKQIERLAPLRGMAGLHLFEPDSVPPMTREQSIRGRDARMSTVLLVTAYDAAALEQVADIGFEVLDRGIYELAFTATAGEVARTPPNPAP